MSIALDVALFLREQEVPKPNKLTLTERGIFFALLFRQGSNPYAWISQQSLSTELDITVRNVIRLLNSLIKKGWLEKNKSHKDTRKNEYRAAEFLINYHQQMNRSSTKKYMSKLTPISKRNVSKLTPNSERYMSKLTPISKNKSLESVGALGTAGEHTSPKATLKANNIKSKVTDDIKNRQKTTGSKTDPVAKRTARKKTIDDNFYPNYKNQGLADHIADKCGTTGAWLIKRFIEITKESGRTAEDFNDLFTAFLDKQQPVRQSKSKQRRLAEYF